MKMNKTKTKLKLKVKKNVDVDSKLKTLLAYAERDLELADSIWNGIAEKIKNNPNQLNVRGVWMRDMLHDMLTCHAVINVRQGFINNIKCILAGNEPISIE